MKCSKRHFRCVHPYQTGSNSNQQIQHSQLDSDGYILILMTAIMLKILNPYMKKISLGMQIFEITKFSILNCYSEFRSQPWITSRKLLQIYNQTVYSI